MFSAIRLRDYAVLLGGGQLESLCTAVAAVFARVAGSSPSCQLVGQSTAKCVY